MRALVQGFGLALVAFASSARADVTHIVQRGHTIEAIAHRYRVGVKAIVEANHLSDPAHLKPGQSLVIPGVDPTKKKHGAADRRDEGATSAQRERSPEAGPRHAAGPRSPTAAVEAPAEPRGRFESDAIHATRLGEDFHIRVKDAGGHVPSSALRAFERMMRQGNATHSTDPRLVALVGIVSNHFGGKTLEVVSGYRAYTPTQYTPHSNHNYGRALDFRIRGVSNDALRDFCRTLRSAGCGYYPNGSFVHLDVRDTKAYWVDWSRPGEPPKYEKPGMAGDEGASEVPEEGSAGPDGDSDGSPQGSPLTHPESGPTIPEKSPTER